MCPSAPVAVRIGTLSINPGKLNVHLKYLDFSGVLVYHIARKQGCTMSVYVGDKLVSGSSKTPVGIVSPFAGTTPPEGWLICDGSAISRVDYADLFAVIGTTYGAGDGSTTFNIPGLYSRVPMMKGSSAIGSLYDGELPKITGNTKYGAYSGPSGAFYGGSGAYGAHPLDERQEAVMLYFDASRSSSAYKRNDNMVLPRSITMNLCIKY